VVKAPPFSPPRYTIWVNSLWFSSLAISLTSALLATLLQQWTRRYIKVTQPLGSPHKRARICQFFFSRVDNLNFLLAADAVPTLLHLSVFLFFAGLLILLRNINDTVFNSVVVWVILCVGVYGYITFLPIFQSANPYYGVKASRLGTRPLVCTTASLLIEVYVFILLTRALVHVIFSFCLCFDLVV
jgi:Family of unknown function (DUF6535)